jgi:hypothetical protein
MVIYWLLVFICLFIYLFIYLLSMAANNLGYIGSHGKVTEYCTEKNVEESELLVN